MTYRTHPLRIFRVISSAESEYHIQREQTTGEIRHRDKSLNDSAPWIEGYPSLPKQISDTEVIERLTEWSEGKSSAKYPTYGTTDIEFAKHVERLLKIVEQYQENY
jgi:hypothetical protein